MNDFETLFGKWVVRYRWILILFSLVFAVGAASGVRFLSFNSDLRVFFSKENPQLQALDALENIYTKPDNVLFILAPKNGTFFTQKNLRAVEELTAAAWQMPYSSRVDSISNFQHTWSKEDDLFVENLVQNADSLSDDAIQRIKTVALSEPLLLNYQISPSGDVTGINVTVPLPGKSHEEVAEVTAFSRNLAGEMRQKYPEMEIYLSGAILFDNAYGEVSQKDISTLIPMMLAVLVLITGLSLRSVTGTLLTFTTIVVSMLTAMGLAGWLGIVLNTASVNAPPIILTLGIADSIHILVSVFQGMRRGLSKHEAIAESLRINLQAIFLTSITTAIGFLSMNFSDVPPFRDLGNIVAIGVVAAFFYAIFLLPALIAVLPVQIKAVPKHGPSIYDHLADFVINHRQWIFRNTLLVMLILTVGVFQIGLNDDWVKYFDERFEIRRDTDFMTERLTGGDTIEYSLDSKQDNGINNPTYLSKVEDFANWYREQTKVVYVSTLSDIVKRLNKNMHGDNPTYERLPEQPDLIAQYLLLYEISLPFGLDLNNRVNVTRSASRMTVVLNGVTTQELLKISQSAEEWLAQNASKEITSSGSGISLVWAHISKRNIRSMLAASFGALILISLILIFAFKSIKIGLISLVPNLSPAFMAFGIWGLTVGQVGLGLSVIVSMTLGIVVDDTIHFLSKYLRARREHALSSPEAVRYAFHTVGAAMWATTVVLVAGFSVLVFSGFKMNSDMGLMTALTITLALVMDFLFLPVLLVKIQEVQKESI